MENRIQPFEIVCTIADPGKCYQEVEVFAYGGHPVAYRTTTYYPATDRTSVTFEPVIGGAVVDFDLLHYVEKGLDLDLDLGLRIFGVELPSAEEMCGYLKTLNNANTWANLIIGNAMVDSYNTINNDPDTPRHKIET